VCTLSAQPQGGISTYVTSVVEKTEGSWAHGALTYVCSIKRIYARIRGCPNEKKKNALECVRMLEKCQNCNESAESERVRDMMEDGERGWH
jgi:hypothetical protein